LDLAENFKTEPNHGGDPLKFSKINLYSKYQNVQRFPSPETERGQKCTTQS